MVAPSSRYVVVLDTCVLAPMPLCDTLLRLAEDPAFYLPKWSDDILRELRSALQRMGYSPAQVSRRITAMETAFEDAKVTGYESLVASMTNDEKDRHVLAAAVFCGAHAIVTENVKHFQPAAVRGYDIEVLTPDELLVRQFHADRDRVIERIQDQARARQVPIEELLTVLARIVPGFARRVRGALRSR